jgi:hypothetical protein
VSAGWRDLEIDGSGARAFEQSVALLLNEIPRRRREEFEMALARIWLGNTTNVSDADHDGDADPDDVRLLNDVAVSLLAEIKRGEVLSAIEKREEKGGDYTAVEYLKQLDGLQFDGVVNLAGRFGGEADLSPIKREVWCRQPNVSLGSSRAKHRRCDEADLRCPSGNCIREVTLRTFDAATKYLDAEEYAEARSVIEQLDFDKLTPYEHSRAEQLLAKISYSERNYVETREHLQNAIYAGGLSAQQESGFRSQIDILDSQLSVAE